MINAQRLSGIFILNLNKMYAKIVSYCSTNTQNV